MSLERKPAGRPVQDAAARTLKPAVNPALRLQELLRRESQQARENIPTPPPEVEEEPLAPLPPFLTNFVPTATPDSPPAAPPLPVVPPEPVVLVVLVNSERSTPVEYASAAEMPTVEELQEAHGAFLFSDEWQRRGPALIRTVRLRRRRR